MEGCFTEQRTGTLPRRQGHERQRKGAALSQTGQLWSQGKDADKTNGKI